MPEALLPRAAWCSLLLAEACGPRYSPLRYSHRNACLCVCVRLVSPFVSGAEHRAQSGSVPGVEDRAVRPSRPSLLGRWCTVIRVPWSQLPVSLPTAELRGEGVGSKQGTVGGASPCEGLGGRSWVAWEAVAGRTAGGLPRPPPPGTRTEANRVLL